MKFVVTIRADSFLAANDRGRAAPMRQILWKKRRQLQSNIPVGDIHLNLKKTWSPPFARIGGLEYE